MLYFTDTFILHKMNKAILALFCCLLASAALMAQSVADQTFKVDGVHEFHYAFAEGDKVDLMIQLIAGRRLKTVELIGLPANTLFRSYELDTALTKSITIPQTGAYLLRITEQGFGKKICRFTLHRTPSSPATARMDTRINWDIKTQKGWQVLHRAIPAGLKTDIHSMSGQVTVSGNGMGLKKNRTSYRFDLPANTVRWAYRIGVSQSVQDARKRDADQFNELVRKGSAKIMAVSPETALAAFALGMAVQMTTSTGGEDIEYAIVDPTNLQKFMDGADKYDAHIWQGSVSVDAQRRYAPLAGKYAFALKNNNLVDDVNVSIEIEAVTETPLFEEETYLAPNE
jgi:hypothetical protein